MKKRDLRVLGSLSKPAGLVGYTTVGGTPCGSAARSLGGVTRPGLVPEGECGVESMAS